MSCQNCLNRRDFLTKTALAAAALVVAEGCGDGQIGPPLSSGPGDPNIPVGGPVTVKVADLPTGVLVDLGPATQRAVIRTDASTFHAFSRICTHQQCDTDVRNNRFECPCHGSIFAADGSVVRGPNIAGSVSPLRSLQVTFDPVAGTITVA